MSLNDHHQHHHDNHHLDLTGVEVHGDDVVGPSHGEHVGHKLRADWGSALVLLVLPDISKITSTNCIALRKPVVTIYLL